MTKKAALAKSLLNGEVISIMDGFRRFKITNVPREIGRSIERYFGVKVSRVKKDFVDDNGNDGYYFEYRLNKTRMNLAGISKMEDYVSKMEKQMFKSNIKRGPKIIHVKPSHPKNGELEFNTSTGSWDQAIE